MKYCPKCGAENQDSAMFCGMCRTGLAKVEPKSSLPKFFWVYIAIGAFAAAAAIYYALFQPGGASSTVDFSDTQSTMSVADLNKKGTDYFTIRDYKAALKWYIKSAAKGSPDAENFIGWFFQNGLGVGKDYGEAMKWYMKAAAQGFTPSETNLGWCYQHALGVTADYREALKWYLMAAKQGNADAQNNMGNLYENGIGVTKDFNEAMKWYQMAAGQGHAAAKANLDHLKAQMVNLSALLNSKQGIEK
jgi:TPR repeat protein